MGAAVQEEAPSRVRGWPRGIGAREGDGAAGGLSDFCDEPVVVNFMCHLDRATRCPEHLVCL